MVTHISTVAFNGIEVVDVDVQAHVTSGVPTFAIVGLADKTIGESKERVRAALYSIGLGVPAKKIVINLAPADLAKEGSHFDLPIACALLASMGLIPKDEIKEYLVLGELGLNGDILPIAGTLPAAMGAFERDKGIICPQKNGREAAWSGNQKIIAAGNLVSLINHFKGNQVIAHPEVGKINHEISYPDMSDIKGQDLAKRAVEIAAAGGHNLLMSGPPGTGKSMLAKRLPGILPDMSIEEILECTTIESIAGLLEDGKLSKQRPFRAPHHSCSMPAMVGGGVSKRVKPGEISLAHNGVLFLDELPEFPSQVIESLRQPIENKEVLISRAASHIKFPANFQLVAAMNPCKCGYLTEPERACHKAPKCGSDYQKKISGPIMDRFDIIIEVPASCPTMTLTEGSYGEKSDVIAQRVKAAREIQLERLKGYGIRTNSQLDGQVLIDFAIPSDEGKNLLNEAAVKFKMSIRGYNRVLRVARTIADLEGLRYVNKMHIAEALSYRNINYQ